MMTKREIQREADKARVWDLRVQMAAGLKWDRYVELCFLECKLAMPEPEALPVIPAASHRNNYGWRSLPSGSSFYGEDSQPKGKRKRSS
jgi:hypothetical protein